MFHPILGCFVDIQVELDHGSPLNWISRSLLDKSGVTIRATKYVAYDIPHAARLESSHRVKLEWKVSNHTSRMQHDFRVHDGDTDVPNIIIGQSILQAYGEDYFPIHTYSTAQAERPLWKGGNQQFGHERDRFSRANSMKRSQGSKRIR